MTDTDIALPTALPDEMRRLRALLQGDALGPQDRQLCRYRLMRAGLEAGLDADAGGQGDWRRFALDAALGAQFRRPDDWIATPRALEILPADGASWTYACSLCDDAIDPAILRGLRALKPGDAGPDVEAKYRFSGVTAADGVLHIRLSPTTWRLGRSFHRAVMAQPGEFPRIAGRPLVPIPLGPSRLPGLAVVHCIVITADRRILLSQRSPALAYDPLHWSASYEEQVTTEDLDGTEGVFHRCARRGLREEFGIDVDVSRIHCLSMLLQMDNLNLGAVMLIEIAETLDAARGLWLTDARAPHPREAQAVAGVPAEPDGLLRLSRGETAGPGPLHATSALRLARAAAWLRARPG